MKTALDGYKKLGAAFAAVVALPQAGIPDQWVWPVTIIVAALLIGQSAVDIFKYRSGK